MTSDFYPSAQMLLKASFVWSPAAYDKRSVAVSRDVGDPARPVQSATLGTPALSTGLGVDALEQLAAELAPGLDRSLRGLLVAAAHARAAVELRRRQIRGHFD